jgi:hypothetical protein
MKPPNGWRLTTLRNSSPPKKRVAIAPGAIGRLSSSAFHFTILAINFKTQIIHFLAEP